MSVGNHEDLDEKLRLAKSLDDFSNIVKQFTGKDLSTLDREFVGNNFYFDNAMVVDKKLKGGIDFTTNRTPLEVQNAGEGIKFHIDPAMLQQLQNAPGFVPVIINIQPMTNLTEFLDA